MHCTKRIELDCGNLSISLEAIPVETMFIRICDMLTFDFIVCNTGSKDICEDITIVNTVNKEKQVFRNVSLPRGECVTLKGKYKVVLEDINNGFVYVNFVANINFGDKLLCSEEKCFNIPGGSAFLSASISQTQTSEDTVTVTATINNTDISSKTGAQDVVFSLTIPSNTGITPISSTSPDAIQFSGTSVILRSPIVNLGEIRTFTFSYMPSITGDLTITGELSSVTPNLNPMTTFTNTITI